eukprot:5287409-Amphidinium_carterae.2
MTLESLGNETEITGEFTLFEKVPRSLAECEVGSFVDAPSLKPTLHAVEKMRELRAEDNPKG